MDEQTELLKFVPNFKPRRAQRNGTTGVKQHNSAQLQTEDYLF